MKNLLILINNIDARAITKIKHFGKNSCTVELRQPI